MTRQILFSFLCVPATLTAMSTAAYNARYSALTLHFDFFKKNKCFSTTSVTDDKLYLKYSTGINRYIAFQKKSEKICITNYYNEKELRNYFNAFLKKNNLTDALTENKRLLFTVFEEELKRLQQKGFTYE